MRFTFHCIYHGQSKQGHSVGFDEVAVFLFSLTGKVSVQERENLRLIRHAIKAFFSLPPDYQFVQTRQFLV